MKLLGGDGLSRKAWQVSIVATWTLFVVAYVWFFHDDPAHDEEYGKWLLVSLVGTAAPWIYCSTPVALVVLSLESRHRTRRTCITLMWAVIVICLAWVKLHRAFYSGPPPELIHFSPVGWMTSNVEEFAITWLFPALFVLAAVLWIEKIMVKRGLLA